MLIANSIVPGDCCFMDGEDITPQFSLDKIDHHELLDVLAARYTTSWRVSKHAITFPATADYKIKLRISHGQVERVFAGKALTDAELCELLVQVEADLKDDQIAEYGVDILFAHHPVIGGFRFGALPMQILPAPAEAPRPPQTYAHHPFLLEYPMRAYRTPGLRMRRRQKNAIEWAWVLNALLQGSITTYSGPRAPQMWANRHDDFTPFWATRAYGFPEMLAFVSALSEEGERLPVVPAAAYYSDTLSPARADIPLNTFCLPDNLDRLVLAFVNLDGVRRRRFLRSAAAIYTARELWDVSISSYFLMCVQAIETMVDRPSPVPCPACNRDMGPGPTRLFREFVERYCPKSGVDEKVVNELYRVRSALAHGHYLFQLDEAPWSFNMGAMVARLSEDEIYRSAIAVAKTGVRNWLLSQ
jgi:hypothetical protein